MLKYLVFVVALFSSNCSAISVGSCKDVPVKPDFDVSRVIAIFVFKTKIFHLFMNKNLFSMLVNGIKLKK